MTTADIGDLVRLGNHSGDTARAAFATAAGTATDPTEVTLRVKDPSGNVTVYRWPTPGAGESALTKEAGQTGRFYADVSLDEAGTWTYRLAGTGAVESAEETTLYVRRSSIV